jgi:hypothetical protein
MEAYVYTLRQIEAIEWSLHDAMPIQQSTLDLIKMLSDQVGSPDYVKTPTFSNNDKTITKKKKRHQDDITSDDWENVRNFKKTDIAQKEGIEKEIDNIRLLINKLTEKTYEKLIVTIMDTIDNMLEEGLYDNNSLNIIGHAIFNMATNNKFNSIIYARLCNVLMIKYDFMLAIIENNISEFMKLFENMEFVTPEQDYDKFCEINMLNEKRRSMSLFLCNLYKNNVITLDNIVLNINNIQQRIIDVMNDENCKMEVEELSENLFILVTNIEFQTLHAHDKWSSIYEKICLIKGSNIQVSKGISHKSKFKHMDIIDKCK